MLSNHFDLNRSEFNIAVCGLRVKSEHEDECCVMIELLGQAAMDVAKVHAINNEFLTTARRLASKGAKVQ